MPMPEKRRARVPRSTKTRPGAVQTTLEAHFQMNASSCVDEGPAPPADSAHREVASVAVDPADDPEHCSRPQADQVVRPPVEVRPAKYRHDTAGKADKLFPIFTEHFREKSPVEVIDIDDDDMCPGSECGTSEAELPPSSLPSQCSHLTPGDRSSSPVPTTSNSHIRQASPPVIKHVEPRIGNSTGLCSRKTLGPPLSNSWDSGSIPPFPVAESQHVRGPQLPHSSAQTTLKRRSCHSRKSGCSDCSLTFLAKQLFHEVTLASDADASQQFPSCSQELENSQSVYKNHADAHPAISRLLRDGPTLAAPTEMWTHRFRPRRAEEVLGNEQNAIYLRNWLRALELQLQDNQTADPAPTRSQRSSHSRTGKCGGLGQQPRGGKRPRVVRTVTKTWGRKKRRLNSEDELDDFITLSDADEDDWLDHGVLDESEDEFAFCRRTLSRIQRKERALSQGGGVSSADQPFPRNDAYVSSDLGEPYRDLALPATLTNTLLISGPLGCGKTAAVNACAEELGWEVFEVYPGVGQRTAANLDYLVGDVAKNHIIHAARNGSPKPPAKEEQGAFASLFVEGTKGRSRRPPKAGKKGVPKNSTGTEDGHPCDVVDTTTINSTIDTGAGSPSPPSVGIKPAVRQSLVLLEEVDILFKEDTGFWPAVVELIRECKRPVVMTCNDLRLVPLASLPLQTILVFKPCPSPVAVSYLETMTLAEGWLVPRERLMELYETTHAIDGIDVPEAPLCPRTEPLPCPDIRRSITQLQMDCSSRARGSTPDMLQGTREAEGHVRRSGRPISAESNATRLPSTECQRWRRMSSHADLLSFVNSKLCRSAMHTPEALSHGANEPSMDDEVGHRLLFMETGYTKGSLACYHTDELIAQDAIQLSRGIHEELATDPTVTSINPAASLTSEGTEIFRSRVVYQSQIVDALQHIVRPPAPLMPQSSVFLDYIPWVRYMVMVDDRLERMAQEAVEGKPARLTRNSMKTRHIRNIDLDERQQRVLTDTRLDAGEGDAGVWEESQ